MSIRAPLRDELKRYRRGKPALDGGVPGIRYGRATRGTLEQVITGHHAQQSGDTEYRALSQPSEYDPGHAFYSSEPPNYRPPEPWHDAFAARPTGLLGGFDVASTQPQHPAIDHELAGWLSARFINDLPTQATENVISIDEAIHGIVGSDAGIVGNSPMADLWDQVIDRPLYEQSALAPAMFEQQMEAAAGDPSTPEPMSDSREMSSGPSGPVADHVGYAPSTFSAQVLDHHMDVLHGESATPHRESGIHDPSDYLTVPPYRQQCPSRLTRRFTRFRFSFGQPIA